MPSRSAADSMVSSYLSVSSPAYTESSHEQRYRFTAARLGILLTMVASAPTQAGYRPGNGKSDTVEATAAPWVTIVWDDPVNLMNYVTYIFQKLFGYSEPHATKLMLQVHNEGKAVVSSGTRESMEVDVSKLHAAGLWATMQQDR